MARVYIIVGPTGVGKSGFAEVCAEALGGIIINGDMGQLYKPLSIGTAKPDLDRVSVPHLLYDIIDSPRDFNAHAYREQVALSVEGNPDRPLFIVGGSLFYIVHLLFSMKHAPKRSNATESCVASQQLWDTWETGRLWELLKARDAVRASQISSSDRYRITRSLAALDEGLIPSEWSSEGFFSPVVPAEEIFIIHLSRERSQLYDRINRRTGEMLAAGWIRETEALDGLWRSWLMKKKIIGYSEILSRLETELSTLSMVEMREEIQRRTRRYAKRQLTFWRSLKKRVSPHLSGRIVEVDLTLLPDDLYLETFVSTVGILP